MTVLAQHNKDFQHTFLKVNSLSSCLKNSPDLGAWCKFCARISKLCWWVKALTRSRGWAFVMTVNCRGKTDSQKLIPWFMVRVLQRIQEGTLDRSAFAGVFTSINTNSFGSFRIMVPQSPSFGAHKITPLKCKTCQRKRLWRFFDSWSLDYGLLQN